MGKGEKKPKKQRKTARRGASPAELVPDGSPRDLGEAALQRLMRTNEPGKVSLAGAYAFGYGALGMAQMEADGPAWFHDLDPLDTMFLGTAWPQKFHDEYEFANARDGWLRKLRGTVHWKGVERFVREVITASEHHQLPVDEGELMLLLTGRLESADLDQRKLPRHLLPEAALEGSRLIYGPPADSPLPDAPGDAVERTRRFWESTDVDLAHDGTPLDALREGVHLLSRAGIRVRDEAAFLLVALYVALVARDDEKLDDADERAVAWALSLREESPLIPLIDALLVSPQRELSVDDLLGHLFALPALTASVAAEDRRWHSSAGLALIDIAFDLGFSQVTTRNGKVLRITPDAAAAFEAQLRRFEEKFGRPPGPDDPIFFDPDADHPRTPDVRDVERASVALLEELGLAPAWLFAHQQTGGLLPRPDGSFLTAADAEEWQAAVDQYVSLHDEGRPDHDENMQIIRTVIVTGELITASRDPEHGASLMKRMKDLTGGAQIRPYLEHSEGHLSAELRANHRVQEVAYEYARAAGGAELDERVRAAAASPSGTAITDTDVLLVSAIASMGVARDEAGDASAS